MSDATTAAEPSVCEICDISARFTTTSMPLDLDLTEGRLVGPASSQEIADALGNFPAMGLQCEVAGIEEANDRVRNVALESFGPRRQEERIISAPHRQKRWPMHAKITLKLRIECDVALIVAEQIELDLI